MGVRQQVISGLLLTLVACTSTEERNLRQIREAPPPSTTPPSQNVTEINNRDLNKIIKSDPKTEVVGDKPKLTSNVHIFEGFPLKLSNHDDEGNHVHKSNKSSSEDVTLDSHNKDANVSTSKFWSSEVHVKDGNFFASNTVTASTVEIPIAVTRHPSFENNSDLTTPSSKLFDQKFKQAVESFHGNYQKLDENEFDDEPHEDDDEGDDEDLEDLMKKLPEKSSFEFEKTKTLVNNETVSKNSIHKDLNIEQTKIVKYKNVYNETTAYGDDQVKGDRERYEDKTTTEKSTTTTTKAPLTTSTRKSSVLKEHTPHVVLDNNIVSESVVSPKTENSTKRLEKLRTTTLTTSTITIEPTTFAAQPEDLITEAIVTEKTELKENATLMLTSRLHEVSKGLEESTEKSTEPQESSTAPQEASTIPQKASTIPQEASTVPLEATTTQMPDTSTIFETTTEDLPLTTTIIELVIPTSESGIRTSKSLENSIVPEQTIRDTSKSSVDSEEADRNIRGSDMDSSTLSNDKVEEATKIEENIIEKVKGGDTTTDGGEEMSTEPMKSSSTKEIFTSAPTITNTNTTTTSTTTTTTAATSTSAPVVNHATTEYAFVHISGPDNEHTTLLPDTLNSSLTYSTPNDSTPIVVRKVSEPTISTRNATTTEPLNPIRDSTATSDVTTPPSTEHGYIEEEGGGVNKGKIAAIVISSIGAVCLVLLAGLLYVMKKRQKRLNYGPRCRPVTLDDYSIDNLSVYNSMRRKGGARMSKRSFGNPAFDDPVAPSHPLNYPALAKFARNFEDIKAEFEDIPQITARTSELPEGCDTKNRYANVIPLPETRVFLTPIDGYPNSDYINANYVSGPNNIKGYYIATQGPMQNTVDDFWRMVWEQQAKVILMLTHLVENGLEKCVDYLPESEVLECSRMFGDFQVTLKKREVKEKYIISGLQLKNMVSNSWREVNHFWYLGWPEKGIPSEANSLIAFLIEARSYMKSSTLDYKKNGLHNGSAQNDHHNPVVIHCSPGTGRTGVVIASDIAMRDFEKTRLVDIPKIVYRIRRDRANAVQTKEQYIFIYKVVSLYATKLTGGALDNS